MRSYIRHPADIPLDFRDDGDRPASRAERLVNVSEGGLAFIAGDPLPVGRVIRIRVPLVDPRFEASGRVTWCRPQDGHYEIGIAFLDADEAFRARMVEQICHIEHYRRQVREAEGRVLSGEEAAREWILRFAEDFPGRAGGRR